MQCLKNMRKNGGIRLVTSLKRGNYLVPELNYHAKLTNFFLKSHRNEKKNKKQKNNYL